MRSARPATERRFGPTRVVAAQGALDALSECLAGRAAVLVADPTALELHGSRLPPALVRAARLLPAGEDAKRWAVLGALLEDVAAGGLGRDGVLVGFGGGATLDVVGLAAALYHRGIAWIALPTTLLAQVDAGLGGKTAVDLDAGKNLVGAFHPPEAVLAEPACLATLPTDQLASGLGEALKVALGLDAELWHWLEEHAEAARAGRPAALAHLVERCLAAKGRLVELDERDRGPRAALNLGHTLGHAIERAAGFGRVPHGIAVAAGLGFALALAERVGALADAGLVARHRALAARLGLPADLSELEAELGGPLDDRALLDALARDKKARGAEPRFVLPIGLGRLALDVAVPPDAPAAVLAERRARVG